MGVLVHLQSGVDLVVGDVSGVYVVTASSQMLYKLKPIIFTPPLATKGFPWSLGIIFLSSYILDYLVEMLFFLEW